MDAKFPQKVYTGVVYPVVLVYPCHIDSEQMLMNKYQIPSLNHMIYEYDMEITFSLEGL